jgi:hypothetical protein
MKTSTSGGKARNLFFFSYFRAFVINISCFGNWVLEFEIYLPC